MKCPDGFRANCGIPLPGSQVEVILRSGETDSGPTNDFRWETSGRESDILFWRYATRCPDEFSKNDGTPPSLPNYGVEVIFRDGSHYKGTAKIFRWDYKGTMGDILFWKYDDDDYKCPEFFTRNQGWAPGRREARVEVILRGSKMTPATGRADLLCWEIRNCGGDIMCWRYLEDDSAETKDAPLNLSKTLLLV